MIHNNYYLKQGEFFTWHCIRAGHTIAATIDQNNFFDTGTYCKK